MNFNERYHNIIFLYCYAKCLKTIPDNFFYFNFFGTTENNRNLSQCSNRQYMIFSYLKKKLWIGYSDWACHVRVK